MRNDQTQHLLDKFDVFIFDWDGTLNNLRIITKLNETVKRALGIWNKDSSVKDFKHMEYNLKHKIQTGETYRNRLLSVLAETLLVLSKPRLHNDSLELLGPFGAKASTSLSCRTRAATVCSASSPT